MRFQSGPLMLKHLQENSDLYCKELGLYVYCYNDVGSIAVYEVNENEANELRWRASEGFEFWSAFLGPGGRIYDDPSYEEYDPDLQMSNYDWCHAYYIFDWEEV